MRTDAIHSVTADDGSWGSALLHPGRSYSVRFNQPGTYRNPDAIHFITGEVVIR